MISIGQHLGPAAQEQVDFCLTKVQIRPRLLVDTRKIFKAVEVLFPRVILKPVVMTLDSLWEAKAISMVLRRSHQPQTECIPVQEQILGIVWKNRWDNEVTQKWTKPHRIKDLISMTVLILVNWIIKRRTYGKWEMSLLKEVEVELPIFLFIKIIKATNILVWVNKSINNKLELVAPDKEKIEEDQISIHLQINNREANIPMDHIVKAETQLHRYLHFWALAIQVSTIAGIPHQSLIATTLTIKTRQETHIVILAKTTAKIKIRAVDCWIILQRYHRVRVLRVPWTKPCPWRGRGRSNLEVLKVVMEVKDRCYLRRECRRRFHK